MKFLLCSLLSLLTFSCSTIPYKEFSTSVFAKSTPNVSIKVIYVETFEVSKNKGAFNFKIKLKFKEWSEFPGIIQELNLDNSETLVEYFEMQDGEMIYTFDIHSAKGLSKPHLRKMRVYPAKIEGGDFRGDFCHLPQNKTGSVITKISPKFNEDYQKLYKLQGKVIKDDRINSIYWSIYYNNGLLILTMPDESEIKIGEWIS